MDARKRADKYQRMLDYGDLMREQVNDYAEATEENILTMDNCDPALIGMTEINHSPIVVYDYNLLVSLLMVRDGMNHEEAVDFIDYNMRSQGIGRPIILESDPRMTNISPAKQPTTKLPKSFSNQLELAV